MPLLIKFTQAKGNSFQLHVKPGTVSRWKAKPESWYFFEKGLVTLGLKKNTDVHAYKETCLRIDTYMKDISKKIHDNALSPQEAKAEAQAYIQNQNPWQFVNKMDVAKESCIDLTRGGIHHSWEEDSNQYPDGNIVYEVQQDVSDDSSTLRSFDQGKLKNDGNIRPLQIDDYFTYLDTHETANDPNVLIQKRHDTTVFRTPYYTTEKLLLTKTIKAHVPNSFVHVFVTDGAVRIETSTGSVRVTKGHSCFIPWSVGVYILTPEKENSAILKTYVIP
jgi:mannose-6-phosphate isomerase class I